MHLFEGVTAATLGRSPVAVCVDLIVIGYVSLSVAASDRARVSNPRLGWIFIFYLSV